MRKTDGLTKAIGILLFAAMFCYMGFAAARRLMRSAQTALAVDSSVSETAAMSGVLIRDEELVRSSREYIDITAADAQRIAAGGSVATAYASASALNRAMELGELKAELDAARQADDRSDDGRGAVYDALAKLSRAGQTGSLAGLDLAAEDVAARVLSDGGEESPEVDVRALQSEYQRLLESAGQGSETITSERAGLYGRLADGFEDLTPEAARSLTPSALRALMQEQRSAPADSVGKLVYGMSWTYAALMDAADAARLTEGTEETLSFTRYCARPLSATVEQIGAVSDGECVVLFSLDEGMAEMLSVRKAGCELVFAEHSGIRVPTAGLYRYYAGYMAAGEAEQLRPGAAVTLARGSQNIDCLLSEIGDASERDGERVRLVVLCWPWTADNALPEAPGAALVTGTNGAGWALEDLYTAEEQADCCCVFTMTGLQAERRRVVPVYEDEEYCLVDSTGEDALRAGNEIIIKATGLYNGKVFD